MRDDNPFPDLRFALPISLIMWALIIWGTLCLLGCASLDLSRRSHAASATGRSYETPF